MVRRCLALSASVSDSRRDDRDVLPQAGSLRSARRMRALLCALPALVETRNETRVEAAGDEFFVTHKLAKERQRRLDSAYRVLIQRAPQSIRRFRASAP